MTRIFKQNKIFYARKFELKSDGVFVSNRKWFNSFSSYIKFEELDFKLISKQRVFNEYFIVFFIVCVVFLVFNAIKSIGVEHSPHMVWVGVTIPFTVLFAVIVYVTTVNEVYIPTDRGSSVIFFGNTPSSDEVVNFIAEMKEAARSCLLEKHAGRQAVDLEKLYDFLEDRGFIDEEEYKDLKAKLKKKKEAKMGFGKDL